MSEDETRLQSHLDDHPDDVVCRQALADLLEERDDRTAACGTPSRQQALLSREVQERMPPGEWLYPCRAEARALLARALTLAEPESQP